MERIVEWLRDRPLNHVWTMAEVVEMIRGCQVISPFLDFQGSIQAQAEFIDMLFEKRAYYHLRDEVKNHILALNDPDPMWVEHLMLTQDIKENLYYTPFMIKCDDKDFLIGALEAALAEVKEPMWFDWYVKFHSKGDDEGDYWEIKRFEEDD